MNILIIEDEFNLADAIKSMLKKENYIIKICTNGTEGEDEALTGIYDLILLDVMLPGKNGFEILKSIRKENINSKVIMLTAKANIDDKMEGFNEGANDYLTKPFHLDELSARIRNLTLRKFTQNDIVLKCSNLSFNTKTRKADVNDEELSKKVSVEAIQDTEILKISVQDKKIGELQKKIQNFEKKIDHSVKYNLGENFEELRREFKENILSLDKALNSTQISLQNDLAELKSVDFLTRQSFEKASLDTHQNILDRLRDVYEGVRNLNFAKDADLKALVSDLYLKLEDKNVVDANNVAEILEKILVCKMDTQNAIKTLEGIQNKAIENIEEVKLQQYKNYSELNFADLLHDSMQNRDWLKDKNFSLYLGAANYSFIYTLFRVLDNVNPQNILEMGMGQTSKLTSQYVAYKNQNATLDIIENDADWIDIYQSQLPLNERVKIHLCNLEFFEFKGVENRKYRALDNVIKDKKYNLVIVDGPLGSRQLLPRSNIIDIVMSNLADDFIIIFDDAERKGEQETISQTKAKLTELGIEFTTQQRDALKSQFIIFSKSFNFARFL